MLTLDQILASNELTIALSSSIPAFIFGGGLLLLLNRALAPRRQSHRNATLALRMAFVEVQRALNEVYLPSENSSSAGSLKEMITRACICKDWKVVDARGALIYRLYRFSHALNDLFSSNYAHWMTNRDSAMANASKNVKISEYIYIVRDVAELLSPDGEVSGARKLATAARMSTAYKCLAVPPY